MVTRGLAAADPWAARFLGEVKLAQAPPVVMGPIWRGPYALVLGPSSWGFGIGNFPPTAWAPPIPWPKTVKGV